jgi:hypothetical protein
MTPVPSAASAKQSARRLPGFLLSPFGWAAEPLAVIVNAEPTLLADLFGMGRPIWAIGRPVSRAWGSPVKLKEHPHRPPRATHRRRGRSASKLDPDMSVTLLVRSLVASRGFGPRRSSLD